MHAIPRVLRTSLAITAALFIIHSASADILFATADRDTPTGFVQLQDSEQGMFGARFSLSGPAQITGIGGVAQSTGDMFAAIVPLPSPTGLPTGSVEDVAIAHAVFSAANGFSDTIGPVDVALPAGDYAVVLGVGAFGATGTRTSVWFGQTLFADISFMGGNRFGWFEQPTRDVRIVVEGFSTDDLDGDGVGVDLDNCTDVANPDQNDTDFDGIGNACDADLNNDCIVNVVDLGILRSVFFGPDADADFNSDGIVNVVDLGILRSRFFAPPGPSGTDTICDFPVALDGPYALLGTVTFDLDTGIGGPDNAGNDVFYERLTVTEAYLTPRNGASIALIGPDQQPTVLDCNDVTMSPERVPLADVNVNDWICARTNDGRISRLQITGANVLPLNEAARLDILLTTFDCSDCESSYDPTPLANLIGWFDANDGATISVQGDGLAAWSDRSGNLEPLMPPVAAQRPVATDTGINGIGSVVFDGVDDRLCTDSMVSLQPGYSVFVVAQNDVRMDYNGLLSLRDPEASGQQATFELYWQVGNTDAAGGNLVAVANREINMMSGLRLINPPPAVTQTYLAAAGVASGAPESAFIRINGPAPAPMVIGTPGTPVNTHELCVGHGFGPIVTGNTLNGSIGEVLVFDRRLSLTEILFVEAYLSQKWL